MALFLIPRGALFCTTWLIFMRHVAHASDSKWRPVPVHWTPISLIYSVCGSRLAFRARLFISFQKAFALLLLPDLPRTGSLP